MNGLRGRRRWCCRLLAMVMMVACCAASAPALAQPVSPQARWEARKLAGAGIDLFKAGDYAAALEKFSKADDLVPAPTLRLKVAECLDKLDRMLEAAQKYREVISYELPRFAPPVHRKAREDAVPMLAALLEEVPTIAISLQGPGADQAVVTFDDKELDAAELAGQREVDPGTYIIKAKRGAEVVTLEATVKRGQHRRVVLTLPPLPKKARTSSDEASSGPGALAAVGWSAIAVGGAGLAIWGIAGGIAADREAELLDRCPDRKCLPDAHDDAESYVTARDTSLAGFVIGVAGVGLGATLLLIDFGLSDDDEGADKGPDEDAGKGQGKDQDKDQDDADAPDEGAAGPRLRVYLTAGGAGLHLRF